jgi:hypothetical protein
MENTAFTALRRTNGWRCVVTDSVSRSAIDQKSTPRSSYMREARLDGRNQRLNQLLLSQLAQKPQRAATDELIGVDLHRG